MQKKSPGSIWFAVTQVGSIVYKGISYTKKGTAVSTKPNPPERVCGLGGSSGPVGADAAPCAAEPPPFSSSLAKLSFSTVHLVLLSLLVKTKSS